MEKGQKTIEELCRVNGFHKSQIIKVIILLALLEDNVLQPVLISIRGDQDLNEVKLTNCISKTLKTVILQVKIISKEDFESQGVNNLPLGYIGPDLSDSILEKALSWEG